MRHHARADDVRIESDEQGDVGSPVWLEWQRERAESIWGEPQTDNPSKGQHNLRPLAYRFWEKVNFRGANGCWEWTAGLTLGYGSFSVKSSIPPTLAHRVSYQLLVGPIPDGLVIDHLCRNQSCVNPSHLEAVTSWENTMRGMHPAAIAIRTGLCKRGHKRTPENVLKNRACRICNMENSKKWRERNAA